MAFRIRIGAAVQQELRRIAVERAARAVRVIEAVEDGQVAEAVHDARRRCKELRALLRLVRPSFGDYRTENVAIRDAARLLADLRDAQTVVDAFDRLLIECDLDAKRFSDLRVVLVDQRTDQTRSPDASLEEFIKTMRRVRERAEKWTLQETGFKPLRGGLERTYAKCQDLMLAAKHEPTVEALHEWRKHVKYNRAHLKLLRGLWPPIIEPVRQEAKRLSDVLGHDHDLAVLADTLNDAERRHADTLGELLERIADRRLELRRSAFDIGARLYAQPTRAYGRLARDLWRLA